VVLDRPMTLLKVERLRYNKEKVRRPDPDSEMARKLCALAVSV